MPHETATGAHRAARRPDVEQGPVVVTLWLLVFTLASQFLLIAPLLPEISRRFGVPADRLGLAMGIYGFFLAPVALVAGPISDRVGRRRMILAGSLAMAVSLLGHGLVDSFFALLAARALAGTSGGLLAGAAVAYIGDAFPREVRGRVTGWVMSGMAAGGILGIPAGTVLSARFSFRFSFVALGLVMVASFLLSLRYLVQPPVPVASAGVCRSAVRDYLRLLSRPASLIGVLTYPLVFISFICYSLYLPVWLTDHHGFEPSSIAALFLTGGCGNLLASPLGGSLSDRVGRRRTALWTSLVLALLLLALPASGPVAPVVFLLFFLVNGVGAARSSALQAWMTELVPMRLRGSLLSLAMAAGQLGVGIGGLLAGRLFYWGGFLADAGAAASLTLVIAWLVAAWLPETYPR